LRNSANLKNDFRVREQISKRSLIEGVPVNGGKGLTPETKLEKRGKIMTINRGVHSLKEKAPTLIN